jgi:hypothetical protein
MLPVEAAPFIAFQKRFLLRPKKNSSQTFPLFLPQQWHES